ncbi:MAG: smalltalk protein [Parabacteroides sp.]|nr:smalltalk protein [Parabacteroides sp.]MBQ8530543.1 smalltalk protein [Parabacteroides sp.]
MSETSNSKNIWKVVIQTLITILTAIGTTLGITSCLPG